MLTTALRVLFKAIAPAQVLGAENVPSPDSGRLLVVANHVGFLDPLLIRMVMGRDLAYAIDPAISRLWWVEPVTRFAPVFRVEPAAPFALRGLIRAVDGGTAGMIFPESRLTITRDLMAFYGGAAFVARKAGATILPIYIDGMEASPFTRLTAAKAKPRLRPRLTITIGTPFALDPAARQSRRDETMLIRERVAALAVERAASLQSAADILADARRRHGARRIVVETDQLEPVTIQRLARDPSADATWRSLASLPAAALGLCCRDAERIAGVFEIAADDRVMPLLPPGHPLQDSLLVAAIRRGAALLRPRQSRPLRWQVEDIYIRNPTWLLTTAEHLRALLTVAERYELRSLKGIILAGGPLPRDLARAVADDLGQTLFSITSRGNVQVAMANGPAALAPGTHGRLLPGLPGELASDLVLDDGSFVVASTGAQPFPHAA